MSAFSPHSLITKAYNYDPSLNFDGGLLQKFNRVNILVNTGPADVKSIQIASKILSQDEGDGFTSQEGWALVADISTSKENLPPNSSYTYQFYNNEATEILAASQIAKLFDDVPLKAKALDVIDGGRLVLGNITNGYNVDVIPDVNIGHLYSDANLPDGADFQDNANVSISYDVTSSWHNYARQFVHKIIFTFDDVDGEQAIVDLHASGTVNHNWGSSPGCWFNGCSNCDGSYSASYDYDIEYSQNYAGLDNQGVTGAQMALDFFNNFALSTVSNILPNINNIRGDAANFCGSGIPIYNAFGNGGNSGDYSISFDGNGGVDALNNAPLAQGIIDDYTEIDFNGYFLTGYFGGANIPGSDSPVWLSMPSSNAVVVNIHSWVYGPVTCCDFDGAPSLTRVVENQDFDITGYYDFLNAEGENSIFQSGFKTGATHNLGIVYYDKFNRSSAVMSAQDNSFDVYIPSWSERDINPGQANFSAFLTWEINHLPPEWATHYQWVYAGNDLMDNFVQCSTLGIYEAKQFFTENSHPLNGKYLIDVSELYRFELEKESPNFGWNFQKGDRVRFLLEEDDAGQVGSSFQNDTNPGIMLEFQVLGITGQGEYKDIFDDDVHQNRASNSTDIGNFYPNAGDQLHLAEQITELDGSTTTVNRFKKHSRFLVVESKWLDLNVAEVSSGFKYGFQGQAPYKMGSYIEVYRPKVRRDKEDVFYYEFGHRYGIYDIGGVKYHEGQFSNQDDLGGLATGEFRNGDVYLRHRSPNRSELKATFVEDYNLSDYFDSNFWDKGRPNRINEQERQVDRFATIYYSEPFIPNTNINGLSTFNSSGLVDLPYEEYNRGYGTIQKLFAKNESLLIFQEDKVSRAVVERNILYNADGSGQLSSSNRVLSQAIPYNGEYGISLHPESFAEYAGRIYFFDLDRGAVLRLSNDGLTPISDNFMRDYFGDKSQNIKIYDDTIKIHGVYDVKKDEYIISFGGIYRLTPVNLCEISSLGNWTAQETVYTNILDEDGNETLDEDGNPIFGDVTQDIIYGLGDVVSYEDVFYTQTCPDGATVNPPTEDECWSECTPSIGCTDIDAINFEPLAMVNDGSCVYPCLDIDIDEIDLVVESGSLVVSSETVSYVNNEYISNADGGFSLSIIGSDVMSVLILNQSGDIVFFDLNSNGVINLPDLNSGVYTVNFIGNDILATDDLVEGMPLNEDGLTLYEEYTELLEAGDQDDYTEALEIADRMYNYLFYCGVSIDVEVPLVGCTDPAAFNYVPDSSLDDGGCIYEVNGCPDPNALNYYCDENPDLCNFYDANAPGWEITDDGSCLFPVPGCTFEEAENYNPNATEDDGSCTFCNTLEISLDYSTDATAYNSTDGTLAVSASGGTGPYTFFITTGEAGVDGVFSNLPAGDYEVVVQDSATVPCQTSLVVTIDQPEPASGCTDNTALNYNSEAIVDDGTCLFCPADFGFNITVTQPVVIGGTGGYTLQIPLDTSYGTTEQQTFTVSLGHVQDAQTITSSTQNEAGFAISSSTLAPGLYVYTFTIDTIDATGTPSVLNGCTETFEFVINDFTCVSDNRPTLFDVIDYGGTGIILPINSAQIEWSSGPFNYINNPDIETTTTYSQNACLNNGFFSITVDTAEAFGDLGNTDEFWNQSEISFTGADGNNVIYAMYPSDSTLSDESGFGYSYDLENTININLVDTVVDGVAKTTINVTNIPVGTFDLFWFIYDGDSNLQCGEKIENISFTCSGCTDDGNQPTGLLYSVYNPLGMSIPAANYNPNAVEDDGSCQYVVNGCTDEESLHYGQNCSYMYWSIGQGENNGAINWSIATNPNTGGLFIDMPNVTLEDTPDCPCLIGGCTDPEADTYNPDADYNIGGDCEYYGCMEENALNYDSQHTSDPNDECLFCSDASTVNASVDIDYLSNSETAHVNITVQSDTYPYTVQFYHSGMEGNNQYSIEYTVNTNYETTIQLTEDMGPVPPIEGIGPLIYINYAGIFADCPVNIDLDSNGTSEGLDYNNIQVFITPKICPSQESDLEIYKITHPYVFMGHPLNGSYAFKTHNNEGTAAVIKFDLLGALGGFYNNNSWWNNDDNYLPYPKLKRIEFYALLGPVALNKISNDEGLTDGNTLTGFPSFSPELYGSDPESVFGGENYLADNSGGSAMLRMIVPSKLNSDVDNPVGVLKVNYIIEEEEGGDEIPCKFWYKFWNSARKTGTLTYTGEYGYSVEREGITDPVIQMNIDIGSDSGGGGFPPDFTVAHEYFTDNFSEISLGNVVQENLDALLDEIE